MISNLVLDTLFARRPKIRYVSPPICGLIQSPTSSGAPAVSLEPISPLHGVNFFFDSSCGLRWDPYPNAICYNVYRSDIGSSSFLAIVECGPLQCLAVDPGCYVVTAITPDGETPFGKPICIQTHVPPCTVSVNYFITDAISGLVLRWDAFPDATCYNVYQDGVKVQSCIPLQDLSISPESVETCFIVTAIAPCGETPQGTPVCLPPAPPSLLTDLAAYWKFEEPGGNPRLSETGGNTLVEQNGPYPMNPSGIIGNCLASLGGGAGVGQALITPGAPDLEIGAGNSFTLDCWFYVEGGTITEQMIAGKYDASNPGATGEYRLYIAGAGSQLHFEVFDLAGNPFQPLSAGILMGQWYYATCGYDAGLGQAFLYLNNVSTGGPVAANGVRIVGTPFTVGRWNNNNGFENNWRIDEMGFWKRVLTPAERAQRYNGGAGDTYPF